MQADEAFGARADDGARHLAGAAFLAVTIDNVGEVCFRQSIHRVGRAGAAFRGGTFHAHVQRPVGAEGKAALGLVELHGGHAEIQRHAVQRRLQPVGQQGLHVAEAALDDLQAPGVTGRQFAAARHGAGIAVDAPDGAVGGLQDRAAVAAGAEGAVNVNGAVARRQGFQHFLQQDRLVRSLGLGAACAGRHRAHRPPPVFPPGPAPGPPGAGIVSRCSRARWRAAALWASSLPGSQIWNS